MPPILDPAFRLLPQVEGGSRFLMLFARIFLARWPFLLADGDIRHLPLHTLLTISIAFPQLARFPNYATCHVPAGPYRESFAEYCAELQSDALPLLIRCPNAVNEVGFNREKWVPSPALLRPESGGGSGVSAMYADMLGFLGRLMGVAIRSRQPLDLDLPSIVWKQLVRSPITR